MSLPFMPSEIARLVLGYLRQSNCTESARTFMNECQHLNEFASALRNGITYPTNIGGKSLIDILNNTNANQSCVDSADKRLLNDSHSASVVSKQLTSIESSLKQLSRSITSNNLQIMSTPSTSRALFANTIANQQTNQLTNQRHFESQLMLNSGNSSELQITNKTPTKSFNSPRRKSLPRRRLISPAKSPFGDSSETIVTEMLSSPLTSDIESQLKIDVCEPLIQPEVIVEELLNFQPLHEALADKINKIFSNTIEGTNEERNTSNNVSNDKNSCPQDGQISDIAVQDILSNLELAPEYNTLLDMITEKELQMTPFKNIGSSPYMTTSSSNSSLNTPKASQLISSYNMSSGVVKNLMTDLRTPEKTVTLYASNELSPIRSHQISPIRLTPIKVTNASITPCKTFYMSDLNIASNSPLNSINDNNIPFLLTENGINSVNNSETYTLKIQPNIRPQSTQHPISSITPNRHKGKRVDFSKPVSELQVKRPDLIPNCRKILPKPSLSNAITATTTTPTTSTTTITVVDSVDNANNKLIKNHCKNKLNSNAHVIKNHNKCSKICDNLVDDDSGNASQNKQQERTNKRVRTECEESPNKLKAIQTRYPVVNILRKMNVNKFLEQIHSVNQN